MFRAAKTKKYAFQKPPSPGFFRGSGSTQNPRPGLPRAPPPRDARSRRCGRRGRPPRGLRATKPRAGWLGERVGPVSLVLDTGLRKGLAWLVGLDGKKEGDTSAEGPATVGSDVA